MASLNQYDPQRSLPERSRGRGPRKFSSRAPAHRGDLEQKREKQGGYWIGVEGKRDLSISFLHMLEGTGGGGGGKRRGERL